MMPAERPPPPDTPPVSPVRVRRCPICGKPAAERFRPFCSKRCADRDLHHWFAESYRIPTNEEPEEGAPPADELGGDRRED